MSSLLFFFVRLWSLLVAFSLQPGETTGAGRHGPRVGVQDVDRTRHSGDSLDVVRPFLHL